MKGTINKFGVRLLRSEGRKIFCMCQCGNEFETTHNNFSRVHGCKECSRERLLRYKREKYTPKARKDLPYFHLGVLPYEIRIQVSRRLKALGIEGDPNKYATPDQVLACVGDRPKDTKLRTACLKIKKGLPPYAENFYWAWKTRPDVIDKILANDGKTQSRSYTSVRVHDLDDAALENAVKYGIRRQQRYRQEDYECHIGRKFGSLKVICVTLKEQNGTVQYIYTTKCTRCGAVQCKRASVFIKGKLNHCRRCGYLCTRKNKNSAVVWDNRYGRYAPKWRSVVDPGLSARLLMRNYTGEYTVFYGTPGYMEALIDADLLGLSIGD